MVGFQDLPSELLFRIIDFVLSSPAVLPTKGTRHRPRYKGHLRSLYCVSSLDHLKDSGVINLLLTSQRMYYETREYLLKAPRNFEVDIAVIDDHWFWPTRRVVPLRKLDGIIERLDINIVPCCTAEARHLQTDWDDDGPRPVDLSTSCTMTEMMIPLTRFLLDDNAQNHTSNVFRGLETWVDPLLDEQSDDDRNSPVTRIETVTISVDTRRHGNSNEARPLTEVPLRKIKGLAHLDFEQLYPVGFAKSQTYLLELSRYVDEWMLENYGTKGLAEKIRKIQFYIDGKMSKELDPRRIANFFKVGPAPQGQATPPCGTT